MDKKIFSNYGENLAASYLSTNGYTILHRNWRFMHLEIDIIAKFQNILIFVEVKTRHDTFDEHYEQIITKSKQLHMINAARYFVQQYHPLYSEIRFDVILIQMTGEKYIIKHIPSAFMPAINK